MTVPVLRVRMTAFFFWITTPRWPGENGGPLPLFPPPSLGGEGPPFSPPPPPLRGTPQGLLYLGVIPQKAPPPLPQILIWSRFLYFYLYKNKDKKRGGEGGDRHPGHPGHPPTGGGVLTEGAFFAGVPSPGEALATLAFFLDGRPAVFFFFFSLGGLWE